MTLVAGWLLLAAGALAGWAARFLVIEPEHWHALCASAPVAGSCALRAQLLALTFPPRYGLVACGAALLAWLLRRRSAAACAGVALLCAGLGLFLYDTGWAASAALAALLRLPRIGEEPAHPREFVA